MLGNDRESLLIPFINSDMQYLLLLRTAQDPLVHKGRHFGRTIFAFANVKSLIINGLNRLAEDVPQDSLPLKYTTSLIIILFINL